MEMTKTKIGAVIACLLAALLMCASPAWASSTFYNTYIAPTGHLGNDFGDDGKFICGSMLNYTYSIAYNVNDSTETAFFSNLTDDVIDKMGGSGASDETKTTVKSLAKQSVTDKKDTSFEGASITNANMYVVHVGFSPRTKVMQDSTGKSATIEIGTTNCKVRALGNDFTIKKSELVNMLSYNSADCLAVRAGLEVAPVYTEDNLTLFKTGEKMNYTYGVSSEGAALLGSLIDNPQAGEYTINIGYDAGTDTSLNKYKTDSEMKTYLPIKMTVVDDTVTPDNGDNTDNNNTDNNTDNTTNNNSNTEKKVNADNGVSSSDGTVSSNDGTSSSSSSDSSPQTGDMLGAGVVLITIVGVGAGIAVIISKRRAKKE